MQNNVVSDFVLKAETSVVNGDLVSKLSASWEGKPEKLLEIYMQQLPKIEKFVGAFFGYLANVKAMAKKFEAKADDTTQKPAEPTTPPQNGDGNTILVETDGGLVEMKIKGDSVS